MFQFLFLIVRPLDDALMDFCEVVEVLIFKKKKMEILFLFKGILNGERV
jgi:hypothetical protein